MKICKIWIKDWDQFKEIELDFTDPATGEPADKICFIGSNGTGKSKLLELIKDVVKHLKKWSVPLSGRIIFDMVAKFKHLNEYYFIIYKYDYERSFEGCVLKSSHSHNNIPLVQIFEKTISNGWQEDEFEIFDYATFLQDELRNVLGWDPITIYSPSESAINAYAEIEDLPKTTLQEAMSIGFDEDYFVVSPETLVKFWNLLIVSIKQRESERDKFENTPENLIKIKQELVDEFNRMNPRIEDGLSKFWNRILNKAKLELDVDKIKSPVQINDNLQAYIKLRSSEIVVPYRDVSTGIRNYIFRLGHIYSLYFNREIDSGFLLVDEPENSLFPDFLFDIIEIYQEVCKDKRGINNTQMFFATHSPIVASQFEKHERIILDWQEDGTVVSYKGQSPRGDDPTDILANDFNSRTMDDYGTLKFEEYKKLKLQLVKEKNPDKKMKLAGEISKLGTEYNFS